jgi:hypothetical protein
MKTAAPPSARPPDLATAAVIASVTGLTPPASSCCGQDWHQGAQLHAGQS